MDRVFTNASAQPEPYDSKKRRFRDLFKRKERTQSASSTLPSGKVKHDRHVSALGLNESAIEAIMGKPKDSSAKPRPETMLFQQRVHTSPSIDARISPLADSFYDVKPAQPLTDDELVSMFKGAPHFSLHLSNDGPQPRIDFPGTDEAVAADYGTDEQSMWPAWRKDVVQEAIHQETNLRGIEVGTVGLRHFLALTGRDEHGLAVASTTQLDDSTTPAGQVDSFRSSDSGKTMDSPKSKDFAFTRDETTSAIEHFAQEIGWAPDEKLASNDAASHSTAGTNRSSIGDDRSSSPASSRRKSNSTEPSHAASTGRSSFHSRQHSAGSNRPTSSSYFSRPVTGQRPFSIASTIYSTPLSSPPLPISTQQEEIRLHQATTLPQTVTEERAIVTDPIVPGLAAGDQLMANLLRICTDDLEFVKQSVAQGGFSVGARSFWRKDTVAGRVLAGTDGSRESLDWISVVRRFQTSTNANPMLPSKMIPVQMPTVLDNGADLLAKRSDPLHGSISATAEDLTVAIDNPPVMGNEVCFESLAFETNEDAQDDSPPADVLQLTFSSPINTRLGKLRVPLLHDVQFISSYPCHPYAATKNEDVEETLARMPSHIESRLLSPERKDSGALVRMRSPVSFEEVQAAEKAFNETPAHPLHAAYRYTTIPIATLLAVQPDAGAKHARKFSNAYARRIPGEQEGADEVVILDCRGSEDLEVLARAWCAKVGEHALVGRAGRTCISCCVREARALGLCAVIRV